MDTTRIVRLSITSIFLYGLLTGTAGAQERAFFPKAGVQSTVRVETKSESELGVPADAPDSGYTTRLFPKGHLYPQYIADPYRFTVSAQYLSVSEVGIPAAGNNRLDLKVGVHLNIVRIHPVDQPDRGWQLNIVGGFNSQNDLDHSGENIGWDGKYGLMLAVRNIPDLALKFGTVHTSGHVADEYAIRTGHSTIDYTREELQAGVRWFMTERWRTYFEAGWGVALGNENVQEPGRLQLGLEVEHDHRVKYGRMGWYAALDFSAWEERDWRVDAALQLGLAFHSDGSIWRIGIERYAGRPPISEFFQVTETYTLVGFWTDI